MKVDRFLLGKMSRNLILFLLFAVLKKAAAQGGPCGSHSCVTDAICVSNTCTCPNPPFVRGNGRFACYRNNTEDAEVKNDPTLTTFNCETVNFPYPCRYLLTHVRLEMKSGGSVIGSCEFQVHAFNARDLGKFYVHGYEVALQATYNSNTYPVSGFSSTTWGDSSAVVTREDSTYAPNGPYPNVGTSTIVTVPPPGGVQVKRFLYNSVTQEYIFQVDDCGFKLTFIPYDKVLRINSPRIPGISLSIDNDFHPVWLSSSQVLALAPESAGGQLVSEIQDMYPYLCPANAMLHRAFTRSVLQNHPGASTRCGAVSSSLSSCNQTELDTLYDLSSYIFGDYPQFTRCISSGDPASDNVLHLFQLHANFFCDQMCVKAQIEGIVGICPAPPEYTNVLNLLTC